MDKSAFCWFISEELSTFPLLTGHSINSVVGRGDGPPESALLLFFPESVPCDLGEMHCLHLCEPAHLSKPEEWFTQHKAVERVSKIVTEKAPGPGLSLGGTLTCWLEKYSGRQGRVRYHRTTLLLCLSPSSLDGDQTFRREDKQSRAKNWVK